MTEARNPRAIRTRIWKEEPDPENPFAAARAYCHGYDVYGDMLGRATWAQMFHLLFRGEVPTPEQAALLDALAVALTNPGPRDASVHAAMCGGACGSTAAASLMAALAVGDGQLGGGREVFHAMQRWSEAGCDLAAWTASPRDAGGDVARVWKTLEHAPGHEPRSTAASPTVIRTLERLAGIGGGKSLAWLATNRYALEEAAGCPLAMTGVAAAAFHDLGYSPPQGEMCFLLLRLPGAAAHAIEQAEFGHKQFPFYDIDLAEAGGQHV